MRTAEQKAERAEEMAVLYASGYSLRDVGDMWNVSGEYVRQILTGTYGRAIHNLRDQRARSALRTQDEGLFAERAASATPCKVCGCWNLRGTPSTCSPTCAVIWKTSAARYLLSDEERLKHREHTARTVLKNPAKYPGRLDWAKRVLNGEPPNRRYFVPGSKSSEAVRHIVRTLPRLSEATA